LTLDSSPSNARDYIHLDDVVDALVALADSRIGGVVNVAGGRTLSNAAIAEIFRRHGWEVIFSRPPALGDPVACDIARLHALGVRPRDVRDLIDRYLANLAAQAD
jgi:nucleoside-diphosphate-sugar epimerase